MESHGEEIDFTSVIENLVNMFGHIVTREVITTIAESCEGDLNLSVDAIMKITSDDNTIPKEGEVSTSQNTNTATPTPSQQSGAPISYATHAAKNKGAVSKQISQKNTTRTLKPILNFWTDQIRQIMTHHNKGWRVMIIMRGLPGSGKSFLSKLLIESMIGPTNANYKAHIFSTDDYFLYRGQYKYDRSKLADAHCWNQTRVHQVCQNGLSPVIVDNTNVEPWEMLPYVSAAVMNGYIIELVEPNTPWAKKPNQLYRRTMHDVPLSTIKRMLDHFAEFKNGDSLRRSSGLSYPSDMVPPVKRLIPPIPIDEDASTLDSNTEFETVSTTPDTLRNQNFKLPSISDENIQKQPECISSSNNCAAEENKEEQSTEDLTEENEEQVNSNVISDVDELTQEELVKQKIVLEAQKRLEELEKFEEEWEKGEQWDENESDQIAVAGTSSEITTNPVAVTHTDVMASSSANIMSSLINNLESKPPRKEKKDQDLNCESTSDCLMQSVNNCNDWREITSFLSSWVHPDEQPSFTPTQEIPVETTTSSTCMEMFDSHILGEYKVITTIPRDINEYYIPPTKEKIPQQRMLDKSTMTDEGIVMSFHCPQKERHFIAFRNFFKNIERESLRYIFDNCCGDANWAVDIVLGGEFKYKLKNTEGADESELEEESDFENVQPCNCMAQYGITPNSSKFDPELTTPKEENTPPIPGESLLPLEKKKREVSDETMQLKRQIEQNVVISDSHYSEHCLKIRNFRRGDHNKTDNGNEQPSTSEITETASVPDDSSLPEPNITNSRRGEQNKTDNVNDQPSTSGINETASVPDLSSSSATNIECSDDDNEDFYANNMGENGKTVIMTVGKTFINNLDNNYGRNNMEYPDTIAFNMHIPVYVLNILNALWMESIMFQLDENAKKSAAMIKEDEEFARQLEMKEAELMLAGKEPDVPDLKEIMDLEISLNLSLKQSMGWRDDVPTDLAAKMTHNKLYNLFPEIEKDILLEMLVAHDNNFKSTVEVLLTSTGRNDILQQKNGLNKFVMAKELERQEKVLKEEREAYSMEWPALDETVDMATVQAYRDEAEKHLLHRNMNMSKAEDYIRRGMTQVASYWSDLANFHKSMYDQANSKAVATLIQYHANNNINNETVDLHYFRVKEAMEAMDVFIDTHIQRLKEKNQRQVSLFFITGRGLHSHGLPKVKPACKKRLLERGLTYVKCNPGLLRARVSQDSKLTYQLA